MAASSEADRRPGRRGAAHRRQRAARAHARDVRRAELRGSLLAHVPHAAQREHINVDELLLEICYLRRTVDELRSEVKGLKDMNVAKEEAVAQGDQGDHAGHLEPSAMLQAMRPVNDAAVTRSQSSEDVVVELSEGEGGKELPTDETNAELLLEKSQKVEALQLKLFASTARSADLQGLLEEPFESERARKVIVQIIEQIIAEERENSVQLAVELARADGRH